MIRFDEATDEELVAIAERYPAEFTPENADRWQRYFEALEQKHVKRGFERAVEAIDPDREKFAWLMAPFVSRLDGDQLLRSLDTLGDDVARPKFRQVVESGATFARRPRIRRTVCERYDSFLPDDGTPARRGIDLQFCTSPDEFRREWLRGWVTEYRSSVSYLTRCTLLEFDHNPRESVHVWAHGTPIKPARPTDEMLSMLREEIYERTQSYYSDRDQPLELYKGTDYEKTIVSPAESWTDEREVAEEYDGRTVFERHVDPGIVLLSYEVVEERANVYTSQARTTFIEDSEYVVLGGGIK